MGSSCFVSTTMTTVLFILTGVWKIVPNGVQNTCGDTYKFLPYSHRAEMANCFFDVMK